MCTLVVAHRVARQAPVVVLANRDEFLARPSLAPEVRHGDPLIFCGLDEKDGGTWFGVNAYGLVVGLTNLTLRAPDPARPSRGQVCMNMLRMRNATEVREALEALPARTYNPFNLVALDGTCAVRVSYDDAPRVEHLAPGVYATTNWPVGSPPDGKRVASEERMRASFGRDTSPRELLTALQSEASRHDADGDPRVSVCCHAPGYGTRASTLVLLDPVGERIGVMHADGPPCTVDHEDRTGEVAAMLGFREY